MGSSYLISVRTRKSVTGEAKLRLRTRDVTLRAKGKKFPAFSICGMVCSWSDSPFDKLIESFP